MEKVTSRHISWRFNNKVRAMPPGRSLRVETLAPALVHWSVDGWRAVHDIRTRDTTLGVHVVDLETQGLRIGDRGRSLLIARRLLRSVWPRAFTSRKEPAGPLSRLTI